MHAIQTSGNCVRNVTADHFAGAAADEVEDPRPTAELIRQWSTDHPEFNWLRAQVQDRHQRRGARPGGDPLARHRAAACYRNDGGRDRVRGDGRRRARADADDRRRRCGSSCRRRTCCRTSRRSCRTYNLLGRRDNKWKARLKILVHEAGIETVREHVEAAFAERRAEMGPVNPELLAVDRGGLRAAGVRAGGGRCRRWSAAGLRAWVDTNVTAHRVPHYAIVTVSLKPIGGTPGDATADQMRLLADLAEEYAPRRAAGQPRAEHRAAARAAPAPAGDLCAAEGGGARDGERRADLGHHRLPGHGLLRAGDGAVDPGGAGDRGGVRRPRPAARHRAAEDQDLGLHQRLRASPRRAHRHPRARPGGGGELPDHARRRRHRDRGDRREGRATASPTTRSCRRWSG